MDHSPTADEHCQLVASASAPGQHVPAPFRETEVENPMSLLNRIPRSEWKTIPRRGVLSTIGNQEMWWVWWENGLRGL